MFPGERPRTIELAWTLPLSIGLSLAGAAGIPAGLAIFMRARRKQLILGFGLAFGAGVLFEIYAVISLLLNAFSG